MSSFMQKIKNNNFGLICGIVVCLFLLVVLAPSALAVSSEQLAKLIYTGKFSEAEKICTSQPTSTRNGQQVSQQENIYNWIDKYQKIIEQSQKIRQEIYREDIKKAKEYIEKGDIEKALTAARKARFYAKDEEAFIKLKWLCELTKKAKQKAQEYLKKHEWLKAGNIYAELAGIYKNDAQYDKLIEDCSKRVRFQSFYKPNGEWKEQLKGIRIEIMEVGLYIEQFYVEKPDFHKMTIGGLQAIRIMTEIPKLAEVFAVFKNKKSVKQFIRQIDRLIEQVNQQYARTRKFSKKEFWQAFLKLVTINQDTIELPDAVIVREFFDAALSELDPFTNIIWPAEVDNFVKHTTGRFSGVGIQITMENNKLKVITPIPGTPAYKANIMPGDLIVSINGESTEGITIDQAVRKITGPAGTKVVLGILHPFADKPVNITLIRDTIVIHTVKGFKRKPDNRWQYIIDPESKIGYIRITSFTDSTVPELTDAIREIEKQSAKGLIIDLRFNPGGTLRSAVKTVDMFISRGTIVSTRGRNVEPWVGRAHPRVITKMPIIVLINNYSASAAEIVSGALKDYHRALIIGERSFGKGSVQNVISLLNDTCRLKLTTAYYYLPNGKCIHKKSKRSKDWGVNPDVLVKLTPNELRYIVEIQRDNEIVKQVNGKVIDSEKIKTQINNKDTHPSATLPTTTQAKKPERKKGKDKEKRPPVDIQLQAAVTIMKARLALNLPWKIIAAGAK